MKKVVATAIVSVLAHSGCTQRIGDFTVASTKNMDLNQDDFFVANRVEGNHTTPVILFPIGVPNMKEATDNAIEKDRCAVGLSDVVVSAGSAAFIVGAMWYDVEGNLIIDRNKKGCENWAYNPDNYKPKKTAK